MAYIVGYCCAIERAVSSEDVSPKHDIVLLGVGVRLSAGGRGLRLVVGPADRAGFGGSFGAAWNCAPSSRLTHDAIANSDVVLS